MQTGLVSVMIPAYNAEQYIGQAIQSVIDQSYPDWELIIVNDGSTDRTPEILSQFADPRLHLFHQPNGGEAVARNTALHHMSGEFVAFLDADDVYLPQHLEVLVNYLQNNLGIGGVYSDGHYIDEDGSILQRLSSRRSGPFEGYIYEEVVQASNVFGPPICVMLRRNNITHYDLRFDENITIGPDWDFFVQYTEVAEFGYTDQLTCLYRVHLNNITSRTSLKKRALELAKCRTNAIRMKNFGECSVSTRQWVFYDLLVNLTRGFPERQSAITEWPEFKDLPSKQQAVLLRLIASKAVIYEYDRLYINEWLRRSRELDPSDWRGLIVSTIYKLNPVICKHILSFKQRNQFDPTTNPPFADLSPLQST